MARWRWVGVGKCRWVRAVGAGMAMFVQFWHGSITKLVVVGSGHWRWLSVRRRSAEKEIYDYSSNAPCKQG